ncbi:MAG: zf-HC2 domain-containing protein [Ignavibacteriales bacterium]|nr:zf-HC2 domain-containing protein [Ignavibacteriales bacterium]
MKHYEYEINLFVDGELEKEQQSELFEHLAACEDCQSLFTDTLILKEKTRSFCVENLNQIKNKPKPVSKFYKIAFYTSSAAAVLLLFLLITAKPKETFITKNEVRVDTVFVEKEKPLLNEGNKNLFANTKQKSKSSNEVAFVNEIKKMKTTKITLSDLIKYDVGS